MKKIFNFLKWLFGYGTPNVKETQELVNTEAEQIKEIQKSVENIKVIHEEISTKLDKCVVESPITDSTKKNRLTTKELRKYFKANGFFDTNGMSFKERQFYARKINYMRYKFAMKIIFDQKTKTYKYFKNGL